MKDNGSTPGKVDMVLGRVQGQGLDENQYLDGGGVEIELMFR